ncbi:Exopolyphosphatase [Alkalibacterium sp. AK22]|uniref:Ppx/GppA family phosphatase n=1 Tax=Alkalibacterium sp. AK22 TaxID=1229520 RepID=UPI000446B5E4|nr:Ppx/GppA family phosphatase [Alkalibacterium sp. AK22]EXJ23012.1 Exopolyphosphatase [Alkalibacterium sp. AK22]
MKNERFSLIDVGSNTIRLVVFEMDEYQGITELQNIKTPARLVQYVNEQKNMTQEGIDVLVSVLKSFAEISQRYNVDGFRAIATAAVRQSGNRNDIIQSVKNEVGLELELLSEEKEAFYGNYAVRHTMDLTDGISIDIGGGSTELTLYKNKEVQALHSFPFGAVSLQKRFFEGKQHSDKEAISKAAKWVNEQFSSFSWLIDAQVPLVGIGGSARNYAEINQRQTDYPIAGIHQYKMTPDELTDTFELLRSTPSKNMGSLDGLSEDRQDIIIPAGIVFTELMKVIGAPIFAISNRGLREGIILERLNKEYSEPYDLYGIKRQTVQRLFKQYDIRPISAHQRIILADQLLSLLKEKKLLSIDEEQLYLVHYGATLYYLGSYIEDDSKSQHTFYIISNTNLFGFDHKDRVRLALVASYKNRSLFKQYVKAVDSWFEEEEKETLLYLGCVIKFAEALSDSHVNFVQGMDLKQTDKESFELHITYSGDAIAEKYRANKHKNHLERVLGKPLELFFHNENQPAEAIKGGDA